MIYFVGILLITLLGCLGNHNQQRKIVFFVCILMFLLVGLRAEFVGKDTSSYLYFVSLDETNSRFGIIYELLRGLSNRLSNYPQTFLLAVAFITYIPLGIIVNRLSSRPCVSLLMYIVATAGFFLETFNIIRQSASIIYMVIAVWYWSQNKIYHFLIFATIATLLHPFSIIMVPVLYLQKKWSPTYIQTCIIVTLTAIIGFSGIFDILGYTLNLFSSYVELLSGAMFSSYHIYFEEDITTEFNTTGILMHILPISITCIVTYIKGYSNKDIWFKFTLIGCIIVNSLIYASYIERMASVFTIMQIFVVAKSLDLSRGTQKLLLKVWIGCLILIYIHTLRSMNAVPDAEYPVPYDFFFNHTYNL